MNKIGLTSKEVKERLLKFGPNVIETQKTTSPLEILLSQFPNMVNAILFAASILSFILKDPLDGIFILAILILNALFGFFQEFKAERAVLALKKFVVAQTRVLRDGKETIIDIADLVPADVVILSEGDKIPADGQLLEGTHLEVDESLLTGESLPVLKTLNEDKQLFLGTTVIRGHGKLMVEKTGSMTRFGEIAKTLSSIKDEKTPLHVNIDKFGKQLALVIVLVAALIVVVGFFQGRDFFSIVLTAISISVAAIPEGLPAVITIALALGMQRMARKKAIIRKMAAIETLGAVQVILTDKTGTLTKNEMRVKKLWHEGDKHSLEFILRTAVLANTASLAIKNDGDFDIIGDKTDGALLLFAKENLENLEAFKNEGTLIDEYVFDPTTKTITVVWKNLPAGRQGREFVFVRGQPEGILEKSKSAFFNGQKITLTAEVTQQIRDQFESFAKEGLRIIGFGEREIVAGKGLKREQLEKDLVFLGFVGIYDPPRIEAKAAVRLAKEAGIRTVMVTGDNELTAYAVAQEVGLVEKNEDIVLGSQIAKLSDDELITLLPKTRIFARVSPMDKLRLVEVFKKQGLVVGVTGDGVNDALALKRADVGVAMGLSGTDVAKEASDVIITDDNFATLIHAIEEGRKIYDNIFKAITYLLSGNLAELSLVFVATMLNMPSPLLPTQILWINLVTDGLPALALASDTKDPDVLKRQPRGVKNRILSRSRTLFIASIGLSMAAFLLLVFSWLLRTSGENLARTVTFNLLIALHLMIIFVVRGRKHPFSNRFLLVAILVTIIIQIIIMTQPALREIFHINL